MPTDNLDALHRHEEQLRAQSLESINARADLRDHFQIVSESMNVIYAFSHDHEHGSDDELTLQLLGIRLFNAAGVAVKLALSGYYQKAFDALRDILETYFLVDFLTTYPDKIAEWKAADKKARIAHFGPASSEALSISVTALVVAREKEFTTCYLNTPLTHRTGVSASL
jgi:hypothetical protein